MDENLDKLVPISNQPEEKIQEIIDMSSEQYPEFESKVRKRIREYLKHCRRTQNKNNSHKIERNSNHPDSENIEEDDKEALVNRMVIMEFFFNDCNNCNFHCNKCILFALISFYCNNWLHQLHNKKVRNSQLLIFEKNGLVWPADIWRAHFFQILKVRKI